MHEMSLVNAIVLQSASEGLAGLQELRSQSLHQGCFKSERKIITHFRHHWDIYLVYSDFENGKKITRYMTAVTFQSLKLS